jgi:hypothetical protein
VFYADGSTARTVKFTPTLSAKKVTDSGWVLSTYDQTNNQIPCGYVWKGGASTPLGQWPATLITSTIGNSVAADINDSGVVVGNAAVQFSGNYYGFSNYQYEFQINQPIYWNALSGVPLSINAEPAGFVQLPYTSGTFPYGLSTTASVPVVNYIGNNGYAFGTYTSSQTQYNFLTIAYSQTIASDFEIDWKPGFGSTDYLSLPPDKLFGDPFTVDADVQAVSPGGIHTITHMTDTDITVVPGSKVVNYYDFDGSPMVETPASTLFYAPSPFGGVNDGGRYILGNSWADFYVPLQPIAGLQAAGATPAGTALAINNGNDILGQKGDGSYAIYTWTPPNAQLGTAGVYVENPLVITPPSGWTVTSLGPSINDSRVLIGQIAQGAGVSPNSTSTVPALLVPAALLVDANRDGVIDKADVGANSATTPFRFWLNDDVDRLHQVDTFRGTQAGYAIQDSIGPVEAAANQWDPDWTYDTINCTRDLEDHARLWLYVGGMQSALANGNIAIGLKWVPFPNASFGGNNTPAIKLFPAVESDGGALYLTNSTAAAAQVTGNFANAIINQDPSVVSNITLVQPSSKDWDFILPPSALTNLSSSSSPLAYFIFEGCTRGQGELTVVFLQQTGNTYTKIGNGPGVYFDLRNIKELYERWTIDDDPVNYDGLSSSIYPGSNDVESDAGYFETDNNGLPIISGRLPAGITGAHWTTVDTDPAAASYILYVHGWNMEPWEKDAFAETAYKRLYWQGYKGRFGTFQWPTTVLDHDYTNSLKAYDNGEYAAWMSADYLEGLLGKLNSIYGNNVYLFSHSMGNVVTGEALRLAAFQKSQQLAVAYVASQAAVSGSTWDPSQGGSSPLTFVTGTGPDTPNIYDNWFNNGTNAGNTVAGFKSNFDNTNDYALTKWRLDQISKPDLFINPLLDKVYFYNGTDLTVAQDLFAKAPCLTAADGELVITLHASIVSTPLHHSSASGLNDQYEIMGYDAEPRSIPLGQISGPIAGFATENLGPDPTTGTSSVWPLDSFNNSLKPSANYSEHPWHSAEFRFDNANQDAYWNNLMRSLLLQPNH